MDRTLEFLSAYGTKLTYEQLPPGVVHHVKRRLIDTLGCAVGGFSSEPSRIARSYALEVSSNRGATVLGTRHRTAPDLAAFANGVMARCLDFNDTGRDPGHPSDNIPAMLTAADYASANGCDLITSIVLGYEIQQQMGQQINLRPKGWDHVTQLAVSSALGAAKILGLDQERMAHALALATVSNINLRQIRVGGLSMWKGCAAGNAARNGVFAALLAKRGMTGPEEAFEGRQGFTKQVSGPLDFTLFGGNGRTFQVETAKFKFYPADYEGQCAIGPAVELHRLIDGNVDRIRKVLVYTYDHAVDVTADSPSKWSPTTRETADHSLPYILAVALTKGNVWLDDFSDEMVRNSQLHALMQKIEVYRDEECTRAYPEANCFRLELITNSDEKLTREVRYAKGHPKNPMTDREIESKFEKLAKPVLSQARISSILDHLWQIENVPDIRQTTALFDLEGGEAIVQDKWYKGGEKRDEII